MSLDNLPVEWMVQKFEKVVFKIVGGGTPSKNNPEYYLGDIPWMSVKDMNKNILEDTVDHITQEAIDNSATNLIPKGTPIIATRMSLGKVVVANFDSAINQDLKAIFLDDNIDKSFFVYWYRSQAKLIESLGTGTTVKGIRLEVINNLDFPVVPLAEQQEIVRQLDLMLAQVEQIKARLDAIPAILKKFRQSVLADAVSGKLFENHGSFKEVIVETTWKHSVYGLEHWKEYKFSDVVNIVGGSQPPKSDFRSEYQDGYIRLIQIRDYKSDSHIVYIPKDKAKRFVNATDVMIGRYGPPIFQILRGLEGAYNVALMKAEPRDQLIDQEYLYWFLQNYKIYNYIESGSDRTAGQSGVNKKHLEAYPILLPPIEEQQNIVKKIVKLTTLANSVEETVQSAQKRVNLLTQSILAKAFSGELTAEWREQHQELITGVNSAESLLAKIQAEREASKPVKKTRAKKEV